MNHLQQSPLDRAQSCATQLQAINSMLCCAGNNSLEFMNASDLNLLLSRIADELKQALGELATEPNDIQLSRRVEQALSELGVQSHKPLLRSV